MNKLTWWHIVGAYLGYPDCCIEAFVKRVEGIPHLGIVELKGNQSRYAELGTGFVPCRKCANKLSKTDQPLSSLIVNRICPVEFPKDDLHLIHKP